jgi:CheY-like chemotaxis protein
MRVLVVDDEALIVSLTASWLEDGGCEVETALNGTEALAKLRNDPRVEMLITDINMPGISGYQLADRAKEIRPEVMVILLSGGETDPHGWPLVRKPFLQSDLTRVMAALGKVCCPPNLERVKGTHKRVGAMEGP